METHRAGASRVFFDKWFETIKNASTRLPRVHDKKLSVAALCALLEMDPSGVPEPLQPGWHGIVAGALHIFVDLPKAIAGTHLGNCFVELLIMKLCSPQAARGGLTRRG